MTTYDLLIARATLAMIALAVPLALIELVALPAWRLVRVALAGVAGL